jgi:hypothetical protein
MLGLRTSRLATMALVASVGLAACGGGEALADLIHAFAAVPAPTHEDLFMQNPTSGADPPGTSAAKAAEVASQLHDPADSAVAASICALAKRAAAGNGPSTNAAWRAAIRSDLQSAGFDDDVVGDRLKQLDAVDFERVLVGPAAVSYADSC